MILPAGTVKRIHVDRRVIAQNRRSKLQAPAWTIQTSKGPIKCYQWKLIGPAMGDQVTKPLSCGARMYIVTHAKVEYR